MATETTVYGSGPDVAAAAFEGLKSEVHAARGRLSDEEGDDLLEVLEYMMTPRDYAVMEAAILRARLKPFRPTM